ncbi:hypothetical protein OROMI_023196 [Orobanche minor]
MLLSVICVEQAEPIHSHELLGPFHFHMAYLPWLYLLAAQQERSTFLTSLMPLLTEQSLQPTVADAQSIISNVKGSYQVAKWNAIKVSIEIIDKDGHADPESMYMCLRTSAYFLLVLPNFVC